MWEMVVVAGFLQLAMVATRLWSKRLIASLDISGYLSITRCLVDDR